jgi:signal transduction histidine kinase
MRSVRTRLAVGVGVAVGALAVGAALIAPRTVRTALIDDRLDAETEQDVDLLRAEAGVVVGPDGPLGAPELTALFGPSIADLAARLDDAGALARLRGLDGGGELYVSPANGVLATVDDDGRVRVEHRDLASVDAPVITLARLEQLAVALDGPFRLDRSFDLFRDRDMTFEQFLADLAERFGGDLRDGLDSSVFGDLPAIDLGDELIPREVFDALRDQLGAAPADQPARTSLPGTVDAYLFGVRAVDDVSLIVAAPADGIDRSVERVRDALWWSVPIAMLIAGGLTWLLADRALRPVRAITAQTRRIRSSTLHERVPVPSSRDEIAGLADEMNTMLDRVEREDARRRQFVADASHELRSPIASIRTQAEAIVTSGTDTDAAELATGVLAEADRMATLVDDLLSLARHDEELAPPGSVIDLDDLVLADARRPRRVPVDVRGVSAGQVRGRPDELARVVTHLLDNAARHADRSVAVGLGTSDDGSVVLTVDDDGPGVPDGDRERVFERFVRLDEARQRDVGGAGLGLAVVAAVTRSIGGSVSVTDSETLGGARFEVRFPSAEPRH